MSQTPSTLRQSVPFVDRAFRITREWWNAINSLLQLGSSFSPVRPPPSQQAAFFGVSPYFYNAPLNGTAIITGGPVALVSIQRAGAGAYYPTSQTAGMFPMSQGDVLQITTTGAPPTLTFLPT